MEWHFHTGRRTGNIRRGFSVVEIALFIAIAGIAFVTIISVFSNKASQSSGSEIRDTMTHLAQERLDLIRSTGYADAFDYQNTSEASISGYETYSRRTRVFYMTSALTDSVAGPTHYVRVMVTVYHREHDPVSISMLLTPGEGVIF